MNCLWLLVFLIFFTLTTTAQEENQTTTLSAANWTEESPLSTVQGEKHLAPVQRSVHGLYSRNAFDAPMPEVFTKEEKPPLGWTG